jgi:glycosyltransferase involved in cell wall biosynthesis
LPARLRTFDVAIIPFVSNQLTKSIYPLKINEYLSAGLPVISTRFSDELIEFESHIYLAESPERFIHKTRLALEEPYDEGLRTRRIDLARKNSWTHRALQLKQLYNETVKK